MKLSEQIEYLSHDERERFEERAAIVEFEGGKSREEAERVALLEVRPDLRQAEMFGGES